MPEQIMDVKRPYYCLTVFVLMLCGFHSFCTLALAGQSPNSNKESTRRVLVTDAVGPQRFLAVHGRRSNIQGYATHGLEVWAYPLQLVEDYKVGFRKEGATTELDGATLLRTISYEPEAVVRTFIGPDFVVQERLFVPLNQPAAIITYTVDSRESIEIIAHFTPVLNLSWPGSIGGQSVSWHKDASVFVLFEPSRQFSAIIGSPNIITHDETVNGAAPDSGQKRFSFAMNTQGDSQHRKATVVVSLLENKATDAASAVSALLVSQTSFEDEAHAHYEQLESDGLQIVTPDPTVNQALTWAAIAIDQTWVCNPYLGCGSIAGYGPSRDARRPQYEWFFAGDGLTTVSAMLASGQFDKAREELQFIVKYRDPKTGMIWHELSQSASFLDWENKYPYMFVHVDITFQYLNTVWEYAGRTGDKKFIADNWSSLESAYNYCKTLADSVDGLPRIPGNKEGGNEQDRLTDELDLSVSWVNAAQSFSELAAIAGHSSEAAEARQLGERARNSIAKRYWISNSSRWVDGYTVAGKPVLGRGIGGISLIESHILTPAQSDIVLSQIASSDFQTDWGTRSIAASSPDFDPNSYAKGSVWAISTAGVASTYWAEHWPTTAFPIWNSLIQWNSLDSLGHMHEVLAGDFYHQQTESVPEQTWSSAAILTSALQGLLGLKIDSLSNAVTFAPHLPAFWDALRVNRIKLLRGSVDLSITRLTDSIQLEIENRGDSFSLRFAPEIPFGARLTGASVNDRVATATQEDHDQDSHAAMSLTIPHGKTRCTIRYQGGALLVVPSQMLLPGEESSGPKITGLKYEGTGLLIDVDFDSSRRANIFLKTTQKVLGVKGATQRAMPNGMIDLEIDPIADASQGTPRYKHVELAVDLVSPRAER